MNVLDTYVCDAEEVPPTAGLAEQLRSSPLFRGMSAHDVADSLRSFGEQSFNRGHRITLEGLRGSDFYIITAGRAEVSIDGRRVAGLGPGDFFGELGVLGDGLRFATVTAETPLRCVVLPNAGLEALIVSHPQIGVNLLREVVGRFHDLAARSRTAGQR